MSLGYLLFDFPAKLFAIMRDFAELISAPVDVWIVDLLLDLYETFVWVIDLVDIFNIIPESFTDFLYFLVDVLAGAPLGLWVLAVCLFAGAIFAFLFFIIDVIDRINILS